MTETAIYARVSTEDQADQGTSLESQIEHCLALCAGEGLTVSPEHIVREMASGATFQRPGLQSIRDWVSTGQVEAVCYYSPDRLSRDAVDLIVLIREFQRAKVRVVSVQQSPQDDPIGRAITFLAGTFAEVERREIVERTSRGKVKAAQLGRVPNGFGRYGGPYGMHYDPVTKKLSWISDTQKEVVRRIIRDCLNGASISAITMALNQEGVPSASGGGWYRNSVHSVLRHAKTYAGSWTWKGILVPGVVQEPVVSLADAERVEARLRRNKELAKGFGRRHWLTGRVSGECGRRYALQARKGAICSGNDKRLPHRCGDRKWGLRRLENVVLDVIDQLISDPVALRELIDESRKEWQELASKIEEQREGLRRKLDDFEKQRRLLSVQHQHEVIDDLELVERHKAIHRERVHVERALEDLKDAVGAEPPENIEEILAGITCMRGDGTIVGRQNDRGIPPPEHAPYRSDLSKIAELEKQEDAARQEELSLQQQLEEREKEIGNGIIGQIALECNARLTIAKTKDEQYQGLKSFEQTAHAKATDAMVGLESLQRQLELRQRLDALGKSLHDTDFRVTVKLDGSLVIQARIPFHRYKTPTEVDGVPLQMLSSSSWMIFRE